LFLKAADESCNSVHWKILFEKLLQPIVTFLFAVSFIFTEFQFFVFQIRIPVYYCAVFLV